MTHIRSKDPFEFVGKHVIRGLPRAPHRQEHGWITRYDADIDCYWLFVPGSGPPKRVTRAEVIKFVANPNIQMRDDDQDAFPPPVEDSTSRFVGVPVVKSAGATSRRRRKAAQTTGKVACFLPFADLYRVEYADGSTEEMEESAIIDSMIAQLKAERATPAENPPVIDVDAPTTRSGRRKRPRADAPSSPEFEEVPEPPPSSSRASSSASASTSSSRAQVKREVPVATATASSETSEQDAQDDVFEFGNNSAYDVEEDEAMPEYTAPPPASNERVSILELDEAMGEFIPVDEDDDDGQTIQPDASMGRQIGPGGSEAVETPAQPSSPRSPSTMPFYIIEDAAHTSMEPLDRRSTAFEYLRQWLLNLLDRQEAGNHKNLQQYDVLRNSDIKDRDAIRRFIDADGLYVLNDLLAAFIDADTDEGDDDLYFVLKVVAMLPLPTYDQVVQSNIGKTITIVIKSSVPKDRWRPFPTCVSQLGKWIKTKWSTNIKKPDEEPERPKPAPRSHTARPSRPMQKRRIYAPVASSIPRGPSLMLGGTPAQNRMPSDETLGVNDPTPIPRLPRRIPPQPAPSLSSPAHPFVENPEPVPPPPVTSFAASRSMTTVSQAPPPSPPAAQQQQPARRGSLKPDWMRQSEELSRTRFTIQSDKSAERRHYQANQATPAAGSKQPVNEDQPASAGGANGVFGRHQRLKFRKQWMIQQFDVSEPPAAVNRNGHRPAGWGGQWSSESAQPFRRFPSSSFVPTPRPILRRQSRYNDEPDL